MIVTRFLHKFCFLSKALPALLVLLCMLAQASLADTVVTPATGGTNLCVGGGYVTLGDITVQEGAIQDFKDDPLDLSAKNFVLVLPSAKFEFEPGAGTVQLIAGSGSVLDVVTPIEVTSNSITIHFSRVGDDTRMDGFVISGIRLRAISAASLGEILRKSPFMPTTDADLKDNLPENSVNHGSLSSFIPATTPLLTSTDPDNQICAGETVTFTASSSGASSYNFFVDGTPVQSGTSATYTTTALTDGQTVTAQAVAGSACITAASNGLTFTVNALPTASVSSSDPDHTICAGDTVTFTAAPDTGIVNYEFFVNGLSQQSDSSHIFVTSALTNGQTVTVRTTSSANCVATSAGISILVNPVPTVTLTSSDDDNEICSREAVTFTAASGTATSFNFFVNNVSRQHTTLKTFTIDDLSDGDVVSVEAHTNRGCAASQALPPVTVYPAPTVTLLTSDDNHAICAGQSITFTAAATGADRFEFFVNGLSVQDSSSVTYTTSLLATGAKVFVKAYNPSGCAVSSNIVTITVNTPPVLTLSSSAPGNTICRGESIIFTAEPSPAIATRYEFLVDSVRVQFLSSNTYTTSTLTNGQTVTVRAFTQDTCSTNSASINVVVHPKPDKPTIGIMAGTDTFCRQGTNSVTLQSSAVSGNQWYKDGVLLPGETSQTITLADVSQSGRYTVQETGTGACQSPFSDPVPILIHPLPVATLPVAASPQVCQGTAFHVTVSNTQSGITYELYEGSTLLSGPAGGTGGSINLSAGMLAPGSYTLRIKATDLLSGCSTDLVNTAAVTVNPAPSVLLSSSNGNNPVCPGETVTFTATASPLTVANYEFFVDGVSVQDNTSNQYSTSSLLNNQVVTVEVTSAENCKKLSNSILVNVNPLFIAISSSEPDNVVCAGKPVTFTANANVTTASNPYYEFFVDGVPVQKTPSNKYTTSLLTNGQSIRAVVTTDASCQAVSDDIIFQVNPAVTVNAGPDQVVCEGDPVMLAGSSSLEGSPAPVTWSGGLGVFDDMYSLAATYTPALSEIGKTITLTLTTIDPDGTGPCPEAVDQVSIQINALPVVLFSGLNTGYCVDAAISELTGFPAGGIFTGPGIDNSIAGKNIFQPSVAGIGTHTIRYTFTDANNCTNYYEQPVIVYPLPVVSFNGFNNTGPGGKAQYPQDAPSVALTGMPSGGFFAGKGISGNVFSAGAAGPGTHIIRYTYSDTNGCINFEEQTVTVLPLPEVGIGTMPEQFCSKDPDFLMTGTPAGGSFSGPGVIAGTTVFRPANAFIGANTIRYTYKDPVSGGTNFIEKTIIVYKVPDVTFSGLNAAYCIDATPAQLNGFPADNDGPGGVSGIFKGPGVYQGTTAESYLFSPAQAGTGTHKITYVFTNENGCTDSTSRQVTVYDLPMVTFSGLASLYCADAPAAKLTGFPSGGTFTGTGVSGNSFIPSLAGPGMHTITYTYTNSNGCTGRQQQQVTIYPIPDADFSFEKVCDNDEVIFTDTTPAGSPGTITGWEWNFGDPLSGNMNTSYQQHPVHLFTRPGTYNVTLSVTSAYGCKNSKTLTVTIGSIPEPDFSWSAICLGEPVKFAHQSSVSFSTLTEWQWSFGDGTSQTFYSSTEQVAHPYNNPGRYIVTLTVKTNLGCSNSIAKEIYILPSVTTYPYFEDFEENDGGWIQDGIQSSWEHGKPAGNTITHAASGDYAWITSLNNTYNNNEKSYVYSPCFDFSKLAKPMISLNMWSHTQQGFDGAVLQSSVDGGITWDNVGAIGEGIHWYNQSAIIGNPGNQLIGQNGWSGIDEQWQSAKFALDNLKGIASVHFRIAFGSNNDNPPNQILDGFAFDDVYIGERDRTVLLEHFTNSSSAESIEENAYIDRLSQDTDEVVSIQYHTNFPGKDPLNEDNPADPSARALFYGVPQSPRTAIDGYITNQKFSAWGFPLLSRRKLTETAFKIDVDFPLPADRAFAVKATLTALFPITDTLTVHIAVVEKQVADLYEGAPVFYNVLRKMLPNAAGTKFTKTWQPGDIHSLEASWQPVNSRDASQLAVVVFIQNDRTKEIYQAAFKQPATPPALITGAEPAMAGTNSFTLYPNPATQKTHLVLKQPLTQNCTWVVYDVMGRKIDQGILPKGQQETRIDVSAYAEGTYLIHLSSPSKLIWHKKLLILHK